MYKRIIVVSLCFVLVFFTVVKAKSEDAVVTGAVSYVLMDALTGEVLLSKNPDKTLSMASTTKILTALMLMEMGEPDAAISVTEQMVKVEGSSMGLRAGYTVKRSDLYYGLMLSSGNDAANVTAIHMAGSLENFSVMMNDKAGQIGMKNSSFVTPSGLDAKEHYSTAYDMALLTRYALKNKTFREVCATNSITLYYSGGYHTLTNHNRLLKTYEGCIGVKTGFTSKSGRCLVSAAEKNGQTLICVTLNDYSDWDDHKKLLDYGFSQTEKTVLEFDIPETVNVVGGCKSDINIRAQSDEIYYFKGQKEKITYKISINPIVYAPVELGHQVGFIDVYIDDVFYCKKGIVSVSKTDYAVKVENKRSILDCFMRLIRY